MGTFRKIDYWREHDAIRQKLHQHFSTEGAVIKAERNTNVLERRERAKRWLVTVYVPNMPMLLTFYGPTNMQALRNAHHLLKYYIKGPSTDDRPAASVRSAVRSVRERIDNTGDDAYHAHNGYV